MNTECIDFIHGVNDNANSIHEGSKYINYGPSNQDSWFAPPEHHKKRSKAIQSVMESLKESFLKPKKRLAALQLRDGRQIKSSRRKTMIDVLRVCIYYMDHETLFVRWQTPYGRVNELPLFKISSLIKTPIKSVKRAFKDLVLKGYISSTKQYKRLEDGSVVSIPSVKKINPKIFAELGEKFISKMRYLKEYKSEQRKKREAREARKSYKSISENMKYIASSAINHASNLVGTAIKKMSSLSPKVLSPDVLRKLSSDAFDMHARDPSKSISDYYKELRSRFE